MPTYDTAEGQITFSLRPAGGYSYTVEWSEGDSEDVTASLVGANKLLLRVAGRAVIAHVAKNEKRLEVFIRGRAFEFTRPSVERTGGAAATPSLTTPMPGVVVKVHVSEGEKVEAGQPAVVVEAMKMIHEICCGESGIVRRIHFREGDQVDAGVPIVDIESEVEQHAE